MATEAVVTVRNVEVPAVGLGTWTLQGDEGRAAIADALSAGYRHIDTAANYRNEVEVGEALRESGVPRDDVWITSKVWFTELEPARLRASAEASLERLGIDRFDLLLMHWPPREGSAEPSLLEITRLRDEGMTREIGVSNFDAVALRDALQVAPVFCDQIKWHPGLAHDDVRAVAADHDVLVAAYSPLGGSGEVVGHPVLAEIAGEVGATPAQVALRWLLQHGGTCVLPRSASSERRAQNLDVFGFELSGGDMRRIDALAGERQAEFEMIWDRPGWPPAD